MPLDPQAQKVVDTIAALNLKPIHQSTPDEARESMRTRTAGLGPVEDVPAVADHHVPVTGGEITVRLYSPAGHGPHPVLVFYHGGGWVIGDLYTHDGICRSLVNAAGCAVASVDYRLAPEYKYPTPVDDSYAGLQWVAANGARLGARSRPDRGGRRQRGRQPRRGDGAAGARSARPAAALQLLIYPVTELLVRHAVLSRERHRLPADHRGHAVVLGALPDARGAGPRAQRLAAAGQEPRRTCRPRS